MFGNVMSVHIWLVSSVNMNTAVHSLCNQVTKLTVLLMHIYVMKKKKELKSLAHQKELRELEIEKLKLELKIKELSI